jgi:hypothetical protein
MLPNLPSIVNKYCRSFVIIYLLFFCALSLELSLCVAKISSRLAHFALYLRSSCPSFQNSLLSSFSPSFRPRSRRIRENGVPSYDFPSYQSQRTSFHNIQNHTAWLSSPRGHQTPSGKNAGLHSSPCMTTRRVSYQSAKLRKQNTCVNSSVRSVCETDTDFIHHR